MKSLDATIPANQDCTPGYLGRILKSDHSGPIFRLLPSGSGKRERSW